jgi:hypothetical protein
MVFLLDNWFYSGSCIGPFIIIRSRDYNITLLNHEMIHRAQQIEMLFILAYLLYAIEFIVKVIYYRSFKLAYVNVSFEREAYLFQNTIGYLSKRKPYQHLRLIYLKDKK